MRRRAAVEGRSDGLARTLGLGGAIGLGLGSMLGTGVFVSIGIAAGIAGPAVLPAIGLAALVALCNALSAAQLAAAHPVSGGTYEYGYRRLHPVAGFAAGWLFLCAKSASAATAALGFAGYLLHALDGPSNARILLALVAVIAITAVAISGLRRSTRVNAVIVGTALVALIVLIAAGLPAALGANARGADPGLLVSAGLEGARAPDRLFEAAALMFVAFTGYGRIATLGEEVRDPQRTIVAAVLLTLALTTGLYLAVAAVGLAVLGADGFAAATSGAAAPLQAVAVQLAVPGLAPLIAFGAIIAMLGVLLNLVLGLSRVVLAMARRGDLPGPLAVIDRKTQNPTRAIVAVGAVVGGLCLIGSVTLTWSFSAVTVLVYYALTNAAALRLSPQERRFTPVIAWAGLVGCLGLALFIEPAMGAGAVAVLLIGFVLRALGHRHGPG